MNYEDALGTSHFIKTEGRMDGAKSLRTSQPTNKIELEVFQHGSDRKHQTRYYEVIA